MIGNKLAHECVIAAGGPLPVTDGWRNAIDQIGGSGVPLFFVLSAFLLSLLSAGPARFEVLPLPTGVTHWRADVAKPINRSGMAMSRGPNNPICRWLPWSDGGRVLSEGLAFCVRPDYMSGAELRGA